MNRPVFRRQGILFVVSAPSGTGKSTLASRLAGELGDRTAERRADRLGSRRPVLAVQPFELARWLADYYCAPLAVALICAALVFLTGYTAVSAVVTSFNASE